MKKVFIATNNMVTGGIEKSLISILKNIDLKKYDITLMLQEKTGELLNEIPKGINIIEYKPLFTGNILKRKIINRFNYIKFIIKNKKKYDISICFASYIYLPSIIVRRICKNNYMWVHTDYIKKDGIESAKKFFSHMKYNKFKHLIFVSNSSKEEYVKLYPKAREKSIVCRNYIYLDEIKSQKSVRKDDENKVYFLNVSRHDEHSKKISIIIEACEKLKNDDEQFKLLLVGDGEDTDLYKKMVKEKKLENEVEFLGKIVNPYNYYKISDCFVLSSMYEGGPLTIYESLCMNLPVISTNVGDIAQFVDKRSGIIIEKNDSNKLYCAMKEFIKNKKKYKVKFNFNLYNLEVTKTIKKIFEGE